MARSHRSNVVSEIQATSNLLENQKYKAALNGILADLQSAMPNGGVAGRDTLFRQFAAIVNVVETSEDPKKTVKQAVSNVCDGIDTAIDLSSTHEPQAVFLKALLKYQGAVAKACRQARNGEHRTL